jgi:hypothetical protein
MARRTEGDKQEMDENSGSAGGAVNTPNVQADQNSLAIGGISIGRDVSGQVNTAGRDVINIAPGATVIMGTHAEAVGGLMALGELMNRSADVRSSVIAFQTDFKVVHEQLDRLGDYKDLHDLLHRLQFHCYNGIAQAATRFPHDQLTIDDLTDYALTLEGIVEELKQIAARPSMPKQELGWIDDVAVAKADLPKAIDTSDEKLLKKVIWSLNRILATQPVRINILLNQTARALRLPALLNALAIICKTLASLDLDANKVTAFQSGVDALGELDQQLSSLVEDHDHWQVLDVELRLIEVSVDRDLDEFRMLWSDVKLRAEPLYATYPDEWADALKRECSGLDEALNANNPAKLRRSFHSYHRRVTDHFFRVDVHLKALCGNMRKIGMPLASVLEMIQ